MMFLKPSKSIFLIVFTVFSLLFSAISFAISAEVKLTEALNNNDLEKAKEAFAEGADVRFIYIADKFGQVLPSFEMIDLLSSNGMHPNDLMIVVLSRDFTCGEQRKKLVNYILDKKKADPIELLDFAVNRQISYKHPRGHAWLHLCGYERTEYAKLALERDAKFSDIETFPVKPYPYLPWLPPREFVDFLVENGIDRNIIVRKLINYRCNAHEYSCFGDRFRKQIKSRNELIKSLLEQDGTDTDDDKPLDLKQNSADADKLLEMVINQKIEAGPPGNHHRIIPRQEELVELILDHDAKFSKINLDLEGVPSFETVMLMLNNPKNPEDTIDPSELLKQYLETLPKRIRSSSTELNVMMYKPISLSIQNLLLAGADIGLIKNPALLGVSQDNIFFDQNQGSLLKNLAYFWRTYGHAKDKINAYKEDGSIQGHCHGLTTLWLYSKWKKEYYSKNEHNCYDKWFKNTVKEIASWDGRKLLTMKEQADFKEFYSIIGSIQNNQNKESGLESKDESILDTNGEILSNKYTKRHIDTLEDIKNIIAEVNDGELVYVTYYMAYCGKFHATGFFKYGDDHYFYDPNDIYGEHKGNAADIAQIMFDKKKYIGTQVITINVYEYKDSE